MLKRVYNVALLVSCGLKILELNCSHIFSAKNVKIVHSGQFFFFLLTYYTVHCCKIVSNAQNATTVCSRGPTRIIVLGKNTRNAPFQFIHYPNTFRSTDFATCFRFQYLLETAPVPYLPSWSLKRKFDHVFTLANVIPSIRVTLAIGVTLAKMKNTIWTYITLLRKKVC